MKREEEEEDDDEEEEVFIRKTKARAAARRPRLRRLARGSINFKLDSFIDADQTRTRCSRCNRSRIACRTSKRSRGRSI